MGMLILEQEKMGLLLNILVHYSQAFSRNYFWEGTSCRIPAGQAERSGIFNSFYKEMLTLGRKLLGAEIPISAQERKQINTPLLQFCGGKKKSLKAVSTNYLATFDSFKILICAAVFLFYINLRWTLSIQQKIHYQNL